MNALRVLHDDIAFRVAEMSRDGWPCRKGCDACCRSLARQPLLTEAEWLLLARHLTPAMRSRIEAFAGSKICPLVDSGACTVYEVRPVACRIYGFYVDREGGLYCSIVESANKDVVWGNGEAIEGRLDTMGTRMSLADWSRLQSETAPD